MPDFGWVGWLYVNFFDAQIIQGVTLFFFSFPLSGHTIHGSKVFKVVYYSRKCGIQKTNVVVKFDVTIILTAVAKKVRIPIT